MPTGTPTYPASIDNDGTLGPTSGIVPGSTPLNAVGIGQGDQLGITRNLINQLIAVESKAGATNSAVTTSLEYRVRKFPFKVWVAGLEGSPTATTFGVPTSRNVRPLLAFPRGAIYTSLFFHVVPPGAVLTSGVIIRLYWMGATAITGNVIWGVALERMNTDQDADSLAAQVTATTATSGTSGILATTSITVVGIDAMVAGDPFMLQLQRLSDGAHPLDTMVGDAQLQFVSIESGP